MGLLDELLVGLGFDYDDEGLNEFKEGVASTTNIVKSLTTAVIGAATAITAMVTVSTSATDEQGKLAAQIGVSVEELDALEFAAKRAGGSAEGLRSSLTTLATISENPVELLKDIAMQMEGLSEQEQIHLARAYGVEESIRLLQQNRASIDDLIREAKMLGVVTKEDTIIAADFQDSLVDIWTIVKQITRSITKELAPMLMKTNQLIKDWWFENREIIEQNLPKWIDMAATALKWLTVIMGIFLTMKLATNIMTTVVAMKALAASITAVQVKAALIPGLIVLAVAAIAALAQDAQVYFEGGDSFLGAMIEKFPEWEGWINLVAVAFKAVWDVMQLIIDGLGKIGQFFSSDSLNTAIEYYARMGKRIKSEFSKLIKSIHTMFSELWTNVATIFKDKVIGTIKGGLNKIKDFFSLGGSDEVASNNTISPDVAGSIANNNSNTNVDKLEINVSGAGDPRLVAQEVVNAFQQTSQDLNSAVVL